MSDPRYTRSRVRPYYRADGTYVGGYLRSKPTRAKAKKDDGSDIFGLVIALVILAAVIGPHLPAA